jgi:hypothetical protein
VVRLQPGIGSLHWEIELFGFRAMKDMTGNAASIQPAVEASARLRRGLEDCRRLVSDYREMLRRHSASEQTISSTKLDR